MRGGFRVYQCTFISVIQNGLALLSSINISLLNQWGEVVVFPFVFIVILEHKIAVVLQHNINQVFHWILSCCYIKWKDNWLKSVVIWQQWKGNIIGLVHHILVVLRNFRLICIAAYLYSGLFNTSRVILSKLHM